MELPKLFAAVGISFLLLLFITSFISTFYKAPKIDYSKCYSSSSLMSVCSDIITSICGSSYNFTCSSEVRASQEYKTCIENEQSDAQDCYGEAASSLKTYQTVYYLILAVLGIAAIVSGFLMFSKNSISAGFIGGGVLILISAYFSALMSALSSSLLSGFSALTGYAISNGTKTPTISYLNVLFSFIGLLVLILLSYFKFEKEKQKTSAVVYEAYRTEPAQPAQEQ